MKMIKKKITVSKVKALIKEYFEAYDDDHLTPVGINKKVALTSRLYGEDEIAEVVDTLLTPERLTLNASGDLKIEKFETLWSDFIGTSNGIMVNSGSSANLIAFYILSNPTIKNRLKPGDEVIVPALNWVTSVTPLYALGLKPVFVDVGKDYCMDVSQLKQALSPRTKAIMVVHLLGFPVDMDNVMGFAKKNNLFVVEDSCEAHGAEWNGKKVGSFGDLSTFSFYLSHHITTIEGGMVMTNNDDLAELGRIIRSQGVMRNVKSKVFKEKIHDKYPAIDARFLFANSGFNFRPTEMEGAFGVVQFGRFKKYFQNRVELAEFYMINFSLFSDFLETPAPKPKTICAWFAYPIMIRQDSPFTKKDFVDFLESNHIETRPVMSGDFTQHPVNELYDHRVVGDLINTKKIHSHAFFIGIHAGITKAQREHVVLKFKEFFARYQ